MNLDTATLAPALIGLLIGAVAAWLLAHQSAKRQAILQAETQAKAHDASVEHLRKEHALELAKLRIEQQSALSAALSDASSRQDASLEAQRQQLAQRHDSQTQTLELRHVEQLQKAQSPLTVVVHPFVDTAEDKGMFKKTTKVEVGYKYQLLIQGLPCMEPHRMVVETQTTSEVDAEAIKAFSDKALLLAEAAANIKGGAAGASLFSVARNVLVGHKKA